MGKAATAPALGGEGGDGTVTRLAHVKQRVRVQGSQDEIIMTGHVQGRDVHCWFAQRAFRPGEATLIANALRDLDKVAKGDDK